jgi:uncharacterized protein YndB with AHSA1/START domain
MVAPRACVSADGRARVTTIVAADPATAFAVFTDEIDSWWRRGRRHRFTVGERGVLRFEPGVGGRLVEVGDGDDLFEVGRVLAWDQGARLVFLWRQRDYGPDEHTEVEVRFEATDGGTRVTVEHRGIERLPAPHPARHGLSGRALRDQVGLFWGELLVGFAARLRR